MIYGTLEYTEKPVKKQRKAYVLKPSVLLDEFLNEKEGPVKRQSEYQEYEIKKGRWRIKGHQVCVMLSRIIPSCNRPEAGVVEIDDNISNVEHLRWLQMRYPLEVKQKSIWESRIAELENIENKRKGILSLEKREPSKTTFNGTLREFQKEGLDFLLKANGIALLGDDMGVGKTVQVLAYLVTEENALPALIVSPLVTLQNWRREIHRFVRRADGLAPTVKMIREGRSAPLPDADFYVINYELLGKRKEDIERTGIRTIIADEVQNLRNYNTEKYEAITEIGSVSSVKHRIGLSGTPCYNHGNEIWSIVDFLNPGLLGAYSEFAKEFVNWNDSIYEDKRKALYEILTQNIMLRRRKLDVLKELPSKTRYRQQIEVDTEYYDRELNALVEKLEKEIGQNKTSLTQITQAQNALKSGERMIAGVSKVPHVVEFVEEMMEQEEPVVVFVHHLMVHELLKEKLYEYSPSTIVGGQNDFQRQLNIDRFQDGTTKLLIAGLRAGNVGINLTAASYVIFGELDWSPAIHRQAEDRLHRIGQEKPVFAYYLEGKNTFDTVIAGLLVDKKLELDTILGDTQEVDQVSDSETDNLLTFIKNRTGKKLDIDNEAKQKIVEERKIAEELAKESS